MKHMSSADFNDFSERAEVKVIFCHWHCLNVASSPSGMRKRVKQLQIPFCSRSAHNNISWYVSPDTVFFVIWALSSQCVTCLKTEQVCVCACVSVSQSAVFWEDVPENSELLVSPAFLGESPRASHISLAGCVLQWVLCVCVHMQIRNSTILSYGGAEKYLTPSPLGYVIMASFFFFFDWHFPCKIF